MDLMAIQMMDIQENSLTEDDETSKEPLMIALLYYELWCLKDQKLWSGFTFLDGHAFLQHKTENFTQPTNKTHI